MPMAETLAVSYRGFTQRAQIDAAYNPSLHHPRAQALIEGYTQRSLQTRQALRHFKSLRYGDHPRATLDFFPAQNRVAPLHVFVHGGYWRALSADDFSFMANALVAAGQHVAIVNYPLLPEVRLPQQMASVRSALVWLWQQQTRLHIDPDRISVFGHSAGGHLVASCLTTHWPDWGLPQHPWARALCLSGLFDLAPFPHSWLQSDLHLRPSDVTDCSPVFQSIPTGCTTLAAVGALESTEFARQSRLWQGRLQQQQPLHAHHFACIDGQDHFTILDDIAAGTGCLFEFLMSNRTQQPA